LTDILIKMCTIESFHKIKYEYHENHFGLHWPHHR
jgi:hypothetical protein